MAEGAIFKVWDVCGMEKCVLVSVLVGGREADPRQGISSFGGGGADLP